MVWTHLLLFSFGLGFVCVLSDSIYLNTNWIITNDNKNITLPNQNIPSGIYSALEESSKTESILYSYNDVNLRWISKLNWTYTLNFNVPKTIKSHQHILITFHGIDTLSKVYLNDVLLGTTTNMFIRYTFKIKDVLKLNENILRIELVAPAFGANYLASKNPSTPPECPPQRYNGECHMNFLRKMQASFSWDWGLAAPSMGIWKPVIIEYYDSAIIRDVNYILEETENFWNIVTTVYLEVGTDSGELEGELSMKFIDTESIPTKISVKNQTINGEIAIESVIKVSKSSIEMWWPNGFGKQPLYHLRIDWKGNTNEVKRKRRQFYETQKIIKIGFRTIELIQEPAEMGLSFYFRVNKIPIFMKGSNWIPSNILPENSVDRKKIKHLLKSAKDSHMNMLRVWGGGLYEDDYFYDLADSYGILIWQDMMFACAMYPTFPEFLESVKIEIKQNIRRLQKHPSIAIWAANNENEAALQQDWYGTKSNYDRFADEYRKLYVNLIKPIIESNDKSRACLTSSPSNGDKGKEDNWISKDPQDYHYGDIHYYNYDLNGWDPNIYPKPRFSSEYGFQSYPSLTAWNSVLGTEDNLTELMDHRQHSPLGNTPIEALISKNLPLPSNDSENYTEALIYMSQVSQAMTVKMETEVYRNERGGLMGTMGALYWQLNDVWVAPSWSSIEFDGKFKILQYWAKEFLSPMHVTCHLNKIGRVSVNVIRDTLGSVENLKIVIRTFKWSSFSVVQEDIKNFEMEENSVKMVYSFKLTDYIKDNLNSANSFIEISLRNTNNKTLATNYVLPEKVKNCKGIQKSFVQAKIAASRCQFSKSIISLDVTSRSHAVFVHLDIKNEFIKNYQFSKNGFIQTVPIQTIYLEFENLDCKLELNVTDIKIMDISQFMVESPRV